MLLSLLLLTVTGVEPRTSQFVNEHSTIWQNWPNDWALFWVVICMVHLTVCSCHVTYAFQSESTLSSCLNVKELLARSRPAIWILWKLLVDLRNLIARLKTSLFKLLELLVKPYNNKELFLWYLILKKMDQVCQDYRRVQISG